MNPAVALICPGPSLPSFWSEELAKDFELVVAVNVAGHFFSCDYLAAVDRHVMAPFYEKQKDPPRRGFITHRSWMQKLDPIFIGKEFIYPQPYHGVDVSDRIEREMKNNRCGYTMPNALHFLRGWAKTQEIHVFGFDCAIDQPDIAKGPGDRRHNRFRQELRWLKEYWHPSILVHSTIDPKILQWLCDRDFSTDPPLPLKHP